MALQTGEGFSVNADQKTFTGRGFAVGGTEVPSLVCSNEHLSFIHFSRAMESMASEMHDPDTQVLGGWVDESGQVYVEVSDVVRSHYVAMELATSRNEIAIYDFQNQKEIRNPHFVSGVSTTKVSVPARETAKTIEA